jgi:hypothetical protein
MGQTPKNSETPQEIAKTHKTNLKPFETQRKISFRYIKQKYTQIISKRNDIGQLVKDIKMRNSQVFITKTYEFLPNKH